MTITTAVVGLGNIGGPIAARIADSADNVGQIVGVDGDTARRDAWVAETAASATGSLADVDPGGLERVLIVVRTTDQALAVLDDVRALAAGRGTTPIAAQLMTTLDPAAARDLGARQDPTIRLLEQPVSGGAVGAAAGTLTVLSSGRILVEDTDFLLRSVAARVVPFAEYGQPTLAKLVNNTLAALNTRSTARLLTLAQQLGLDARQLKDVVDTSSGASAMGAMIADFADEQAELLTKDVALLATAVPSLPVIGLADPDGFLDDLRTARNLLDDNLHDNLDDNGAPR